MTVNQACVSEMDLWWVVCWDYIANCIQKVALSVHLSSNKVDKTTFISLVDLNVAVTVPFDSA